MWLIICLIVGGGILGAVLNIHGEAKRKDKLNSLSSKLEQEGFTVSKKLFNPNNTVALFIDDVNNKWAIAQSIPLKYDIYDYKDLIEYELIEDGSSIIKGRVGSAIVGGALFGAAGAIIGSARGRSTKPTCTSMSINITVDNLNAPHRVIPIISSEVKKSSVIYTSALNTANEIISTLALIKSKAEEAMGVNLSTNCSIDDIEKLYNLKEKGIITEQEFEDKKKQLLNL